jgi:hypothetical protein
MADWIAQYAEALDVRDSREKAHKQYIDACQSVHAARLAYVRHC